jgi:hypothetical protein
VTDPFCSGDHGAKRIFLLVARVLDHVAASFFELADDGEDLVDREPQVREVFMEGCAEVREREALGLQDHKGAFALADLVGVMRMLHSKHELRNIHGRTYDHERVGSDHVDLPSSLCCCHACSSCFCRVLVRKNLF